MAHLVSTDRERLLAYGRAVGLPGDRLQLKPLKDPRTNDRRDAWHWDLLGRFLPPPASPPAHDHRSNRVSPSSDSDAIAR